VPNLSQLITQDRGQAKNQIRDWLLPSRPTNPGVATRKAGEILNFANVIAENDLALAVEGQRVLGIGRVTGPYAYDDQLDFPHKRPVEWLSLDEWQMPVAEGPHTTVFELGRSSDNLLSTEEHLFRDTHWPRNGRTCENNFYRSATPSRPARSENRGDSASQRASNHLWTAWHGEDVPRPPSCPRTRIEAAVRKRLFLTIGD
jgi:hypothetical protein